MNKLATAMQEGEYDAERPPSKVGNSGGNCRSQEEQHLGRAAAPCGRAGRQEFGEHLPLA